MKFGRFAQVSAVSVAALTMSFAGTALAEPAASDEPTQVTVSTAMERAGFVPEVAIENGYEVRTTPDGQKYAVKPGELHTNGYDIVYGNCGSSYIQFDGIGGLDARLATGFDVRATVVGGAWGTTLIDNGGSSEQNFDISTGSASWDGYRQVPNLTAGSAFAEVDTPYSFTLLSDGTVCISGGPSTTTTIY